MFNVANWIVHAEGNTALVHEFSKQEQLEYEILLRALARLDIEGYEIGLPQFQMYIIDRNTDGSGFLTSVADDRIPTMFPEAMSGDVNQLGGYLNGGTEHVGFVLMVKFGRVAWIEGFTYSGNAWPEIVDFNLYAGKY